jgi:hypothetical protein
LPLRAGIPKEGALTPARLVAIGFIYCCAAVAWFSLGASIVNRTGEFDQKLAREVSQLWGGQHSQLAPDAWLERAREVKEKIQEHQEGGKVVSREISKTVYDRVPVPLISSQVRVGLELDQRRKGLLWYDTYRVAFQGEYRFRPPKDAVETVRILFAFPSVDALYDSFVLRVDGRDAPPASDLSQGILLESDGGSGAERVVTVSYRSRGLGDWTYAFVKAGVAQVRDFSLEMTTDFAEIDFPAGTVSPTSRSREGRGHRLAWEFESLVTGQKIGMDAPDRLNPGPLASRITFFAPVGLLFFVTVMVILGAIRGSGLHPMNYFFLAAAFFSFHLLLAYLADHLDIHASFAIASTVSVLLVVSYLRLVVGLRSALVEAGLAQLVFLVLFSYAFFFEGYTGLTVTVGAVLTLFVLMQITGRVDWAAIMQKRR